LRKLSIRAKARLRGGHVRLQALPGLPDTLLALVINARRGHVGIIDDDLLADLRMFVKSMRSGVYMKRKYGYLDIDVGADSTLYPLAELIGFCDRCAMHEDFNEFVRLSKLTVDEMFNPHIHGLQAVRRYALSYVPTASVVVLIEEVPSKADEIFKMLGGHLSVDHYHIASAQFYRIRKAAECKKSANAVLREMGL